jgi:hypothetical protein
MESQIVYWFHGDVCLNIHYSDNPPASDKKYVKDDITDNGNVINHTLSFEGHRRNIQVPKMDQKNPKYLRAIHMAVHKFLQDGKKESVKYVAAGKYQYCTRKQHEKLMGK